MLRKILPVGNDLYVVKRRFKIENFEKILNHFGAQKVCDAYHCETVLRGGDGYFYLCDRVDDAKIIEK
jgi:hypothetical protein